ncbi:TPA: hypothetical protein J1X80_004802, partial [Escherichia coli]|nr:hypothetical protein [Escherichia coli]
MTVLSGSISHNSAFDDEFLWLEELHDEKSLQWVKKENQRTIAHFARNQNFLRIEREVLNILN